MATIYRVTTLNDTPLGNTLRHACEASGERIVVFEVSGYIELESELRITNPYISIFGQTAPGSGVSINYEQFVVATHDVMVSYLRFNPGPSGSTPMTTSALIIEYEEDVTGDVDMLPYNICFDHCTFRWGPNGNIRLRNLNWDDSVAENNVSVGYIQRVTFQWCYIYEAFDGVGTLTEASVGMEIGGGCTQITVAYCLFASCREGLQIRGGQVEVVNCVFFNCHIATRLGAARTYAGLEPCTVNYWRNQQIHGNNSQQNHMVIVGDGSLTCTNPAGELPHEIYVSTNEGRYKVPGVPAAQWDIMGCLEGGPSNDASDIWRVLMPHTMWGRAVQTDTLANGYTRILAHGGCKMTSTYGRDKADRRIVQAVKAHGGKLPVSTMAEVHGWPYLAVGTVPLDSDGDGVPDWFENANGSDPNVADSDEYDYDSGTHRQGYMNIEVYENVHGRNPHVVTWVQVN